MQPPTGSWQHARATGTARAKRLWPLPGKPLDASIHRFRLEE
jgi:hypothetical protein